MWYNKHKYSGQHRPSITYTIFTHNPQVVDKVAEKVFEVNRKNNFDHVAAVNDNKTELCVGIRTPGLGKVKRDSAGF